MSTFELKTHQIGRNYSNPHFFILNKGLNSGKPLSNPCPNCFVVITKTQTEKNTLFHLSMMLQIGGFYAINLVGSVIPFLRIKDCRNTIIMGLNSTSSTDSVMQETVNIISAISKKEKELIEATNKITALKIAYIQSCFK